MIKRLGWVFFSLLVCLPHFAWAQNLPDVSFFSPTPHDLSLEYLASIFGVVDGVLHGTGSQILGTMFGVFNAAVLALGSIIIMYTLIVSTLNTAHEGEVMGKQWSSIWIPLRSVAGFAMIVPKASGYCFIQIFVMWVVVQGIGAADTLWNAALNYVERGGVLVQVEASAQDLGVTDLIQPSAQGGSFTGNIFKSQICMFAIENLLKNSAGPNDVVPDAASSLNVTPGKVSFPGYFQVTNGGEPVGAQFKGACGDATWEPAEDGAESSHPIANPAGLSASDSRSIAVQQVILDTQGLAQQVANILVPPANQPNGITVATALNGNATIVGSAMDYIAIMQPYLALQGEKKKKSVRDALKKSGENGWILAGAYFHQLASLNAALSEKDSSPPSVKFTGNFVCSPSSSSPICTLQNIPQSLIDQLSPGKGGNTAFQCKVDPPSQFLETSPFSDVNNNICLNAFTSGQVQRYENPDTDQPQSAIGLLPTQAKTGEPRIGKTLSGAAGAAAGVGIVAAAGTANPVLGLLFLEMLGMSVDIGESVQKLSSMTVDPLLAIAHLGHEIVNWVEVIWLTGTIAAFWIQMVAALMAACNPAAYAIITSLIFFIPIFTGIAIALLAAGAMMAYYVPLIPFIVFLFTSIGWFVAVIEAMVAAPLVALGIAHPEGQHQVWGKAGPAIMLLTNVFIRPSMIIIGFIVAIILSHVGLWLLNEGLYIINPVHGWKDAFFDLITITMTMIIYVSIVLSIINRCFALTYEIPNRVLRWIEGGAEVSFGEAEGVREVHGMAQAGAGAIQGAMQHAGPKEAMDAKKASEDIEDRNKKKPPTTLTGG